MKIKLRNGKTTKDVRLDRLVQFDERNRNFPIRKLLKAKKLRSYTWRCTTTLDQGNEGSCVGHGIAHELLAMPAPADPTIVTHTYARETIYWGAQKIDEWPGGSYPGAKPQYEGSSVLAGTKCAQALGWFDSYRWAFSLNDLILGVGYNGPSVLGLDWYEGMMDTDETGFINPVGEWMGGHCILCRGVSISGKYFILRNSWGQGWGINGGDCKISFSDMQMLLKDQGESVFFVDRRSIV